MSAFAGRFALDGLLGSGATASVYSAHDAETGASVAVKVLHPRLSGTAAEREAFFAEAVLARRVRHPGVPAVLGHGVDEEGGEPRAWIATARAPGRTLARIVEADGPLDPVAALAVAARLLDAVAAVHAAGLVHRDVAPGNVVVEEDGAVSLLDFGLADAPGRPAVGGDVLRSAGVGGGAEGEAAGGVIGSVNYLSPEQALGASVDERGDLYQVAGLLHYALTGRPPFPRPTTEQTMAAHVSAPPPVPSALDSRIPLAADEVVVRGLMKEPGARYASATQMAAAVRAALGERAPRDATTLLPAVDADGGAAAVGARAAVAPSVFIGPGGELVDREAATAVIPKGRRDAGAAADRRAGAGPGPDPTDLSAIGPLRSPATIRMPATAATRGSSAPVPSPVPSPVPPPATATPPGAVAASSRAASRTGRTALAVTAGAVAVAATIWLVAANATPATPPPLVTVPSAPVVVPTTPAAPPPTAAPVVTAPQTATVPELGGLSRADAVARLAAAGFAAGPISTRDGVAAAATVLESTPAAGATAEPGSTVALVEASGRNAVPELHGQSLLAAGATLTAAGFAVVERAAVDSTVPDGTVLGSEPGAGTVLALGAPVTVVVSRLPAQPTPTPTPSAPTTPSPTRPPSP